MTMARNFRGLCLAACSSAALLSTGCATPSLRTAAADSFPVGRNAAGDACTATRSWGDKALSGLFNASWAITCRNVSASRSLGFVRVLKGDGAAVDAVEATLNCGAAQPVAVPRLGSGDARRCIDTVLGIETVALKVARKGNTIIGSGQAGIIGPLEEAMRIAGGLAPSGKVGESIAATVDFAALAPPPGQVAAPGTGAFDAAVALQQGITLNHRGLHNEASRLLNDALSRLPADADPSLRAELSLEAGLADSNIRFTEAAAEHFTRANGLIDAGVGDRRAQIARKRDTYRALDLLNRRQFRPALVALDRLSTAPSTAQPLQNAAVLRSLNQRSGVGLARSVAVSDTETLFQLVMDAQANWARSVAYFNLGEFDRASAALADADAAFAPLGAERIEQGPVLWLKAKLERQRGRLAAQRRDWPQALASYDRAVEALTLGAFETGGTGREPAIAELRVERATVIAQQGGPSDTVRNAFSDAVDALIESGASTGFAPSGLDAYLDILVAEKGRGGQPDTDEKFFRALQSVGEPAIGRQISRIQQVVSADSAVSARLRERSALEAQLTGLRYQIGSLDPSQAESAADLERRRQAAQARLDTLNNELGSNARLGTVEERPASIAEIRSALRPGEVFFKVSELNRKIYGVLIAADGTTIYQSEAPARTLADFAKKIRASIDGQLGPNNKIVEYDLASSYALFTLLAGPAAERLLAANAIIVDPAGPLENLPLGVLVTDRASLDAYKRTRRSRELDYSAVSFLARRAAISTAVSPRSFLTARSLPSSNASKPFIGFAEPEVPDVGAPGPANPAVDVGSVCSVQYSVLRQLAADLAPISRQQAVLAADAFGTPGAPIVSGAAFSDSAVRDRDDLGQYAVLHFATHGLLEGAWGCTKSPPALVTSFGDANSDGLLSFDEIARLRLNANLVVLSACDTGSGIRSQSLARRSGQEEAGATLQGLVRAFLTANTRAVMATHWKVPTRVGTDEFYQTFYSTARGTDIGGSLQAGQRRLIADPRYSHPFYWGAYFVVGDSSKTMLGGKGRGSE